MNPFVIILVRPRDPNNIGACARAMANFGFNELRIVDPYAPVWQEAVSAVGAHDILKQAKLCSTLDEALADTQFSLATTALRNRVTEQPILFLPDIKDFCKIPRPPHGHCFWKRKKRPKRAGYCPLQRGIKHPHHRAPAFH